MGLQPLKRHALSACDSSACHTSEHQLMDNKSSGFLMLFQRSAHDIFSRCPPPLLSPHWHGRLARQTMAPATDHPTPRWPPADPPPHTHIHTHTKFAMDSRISHHAASKRARERDKERDSARTRARVNIKQRRAREKRCNANTKTQTYMLELFRRQYTRIGQPLQPLSSPSAVGGGDGG